MNLNVPQYNGIEVDMLSLGDADSILVTNWVNGVPQRVLIDGGNKEDSDKVCQFLLQRGARYIDHVVCSHPHDDHAAGLVEIIGCKHLTFGHAWMHLPWQHIDQRTLANALAQSKASRFVRIINASLQTQQAILKAIQSRGIPLSEPFKGQHVGFMFTCGPSKEYYEELLKEFSDLEKLERFEEALAAHERSLMVEELWKGSIVGGKASESKESAVLGGAPTEPENNSATVLFTKWGNDQCLFTSDAGVPALDRVKKAYALANLRWLQIPHHGSRRNINHDLIRYFAPEIANVSANGDKKHPRRAVVNAFKEVGTKVFSTHYPNDTNLWFRLGQVPERLEYSAATPLYEADKIKRQPAFAL